MRRFAFAFIQFGVRFSTRRGIHFNTTFGIHFKRAFGVALIQFRVPFNAAFLASSLIRFGIRFKSILRLL